MRHFRFTRICSDATQLVATCIDQNSFIPSERMHWALSVALINTSVEAKKKGVKRVFSLLTYSKTAVKGKTIAARDFLPLLNRICSTSAYIT